jgi:hypothetical protein
MPTPLLMATPHFQPWNFSCNPSKWETDIWGWLDFKRSTVLLYTANQCLYSVLSLLTVWGTRPGVTSCQKMATLPAGYILQRKVLSESSSAVGIWFTCLCGWDDNPCLGVRNTRIGDWPNSLDQTTAVIRSFGRFCRSPNSLCMGFTFLTDENTSKYFYNYFMRMKQTLMSHWKIKNKSLELRD